MPYAKIHHEAMTKQKSILPLLALIVSSMLWGLNPPFIKLGVETIPPVIFLSMRFLLASLIMLPFAIKTWQPLKAKEMYLLILGSVMFVSVASLALNLGLARTNSINAGVLSLLGPLLLCILSVQFLKEKLSAKTLIGIMVAFAGSLVIIGRPWESAGASLTGNLW
jgi:O-acetylserine/cysteine efflux transporter